MSGPRRKRPAARRAALVVWLGVFLFMGTPARAQPPPAGSPQAKAIQLFRRANPQLYLGNYRKAIALYRKALKLFPKMAGAWRNMGKAYEGLKSWKRAIKAYDQYLTLAGTAGRYSLAAMARINECRKKLGLPPRVFNIMGAAGRIAFKVNVPGAAISLDGLRRGSSPSPALPVSAGLHVVTVTKVGYLAWTNSIGVRAGKTVMVRVDLEKDPHYVPPRRVEGIKVHKAKNEAYLTVRSSAPNVSLYVDGKAVARRADGVFVLAKPRSHVVEVRAPGRLPWRARVDLLRGEKKTLVPVLALLSQKRSFARWGWITLGFAGALGVVGAVFSGLENQTYDKVNSRDAADRDALNDLVRKGKTYRNVSLGLYAGAAAFLISSIVLFVYERKGERPQGRPLPLVIGPTSRGSGVALSYSGEVDF
ncbi:MAG: PEGA domain-containing protein [bacterium]